ncbi:MAG: DMT family transporter [Pseudomonadota bacterium]
MTSPFKETAGQPTTGPNTAGGLNSPPDRDGTDKASAARSSNTPTPRAVLWGSLAMIASVLAFTILDTVNKILVETYSAFFLSWSRTATQVALMLLLAPLLGGTAMFRTKRPLLQVARGVMIAGVSICVTLSISHLPLTQTYVIGFLTPFLATVLAAFVLKERASVLQWVLISLAFAGVLIALRPGAPDAGWHLIYPLGFAVFNAVYFVLTRAGGQTDNAIAQLFYVGLFAMVTLSVSLPWHWEAPTWPHLGMIGFVGICGTLGHLLLITAFAYAPTAIVAPMVYFQIIWSSVIGYLVFDDVPLLTTWVGAVVIVACGVALIRTQAQARR